MNQIKRLPDKVVAQFHLDPQMKRYYTKFINSSSDRLTHTQMIDLIKIDLLLKIHALEMTPYLSIDELFDDSCF